MDGFMQLIDEKYKQQHYPNGYFGAVVEGNRSMTLAYVIFAVFVLFSLPFFFLGMRALSNAHPMVGGIIIGVGILPIGVGLFLIRVFKKRKGKSRQDWVQECAKKSLYSIEDMEAFDLQFMTGNAYFLAPNGKPDKINPVVMTADFISTPPFIFKQSDLKAACLFLFEDVASVGNAIKLTKTLQLGLISDRGRTWVNTDKKQGTAFLSMLKEKYPAIETKDSAILNGNEFDALVKAYTKPS